MSDSGSQQIQTRHMKEIVKEYAGRNLMVYWNNEIPGVSSQPITWASDGTVSENEYTQYQQIGDIQVFSRVAGDFVYLALRAPNEGYVALGLRPDNKMQGADMLLCSLNDSQATATDAYATGLFGPHPADTELGGSDLLDISGGQQNDWETFEFKRKLHTGDSHDKDLVIGDNPIIWAMGSSPDINGHHKSRGYGNLILK